MDEAREELDAVIILKDCIEIMIKVVHVYKLPQ